MVLPLTCLSLHLIKCFFLCVLPFSCTPYLFLYPVVSARLAGNSGALPWLRVAELLHKDPGRQPQGKILTLFPSLSAAILSMHLTCIQIAWEKISITQW